ncbi:tRNA (N(6)-L-threonylcarbamoyladenosine(37)-C(2))-methylthiotransferase MtaB [Alienimonas californiensis]|uniref:Threonylcarbamoyladenosine tRNA methylthiotransferase MtaB n=1 Tax=Alienimonas californiensis TaxID=2527989 RepID=A0A517PET2_9PLAN|nr:tRNA (N(6)-L-threonylcarbamoyladenosine(37)-C(2))-methylthiotransferase MtaB [Alienimonas californiensis]QDT17882.1 Threonylcarbamoyladenosine tRNA methylthiotransferase MtaB [Alienimonas californiensis]
MQLPVLTAAPSPAPAASAAATDGAAPTCRLVTLGCKVNQYETQLVRETLLANGYREAGDGEGADLCVVNTCTVTAAGDKKGRQLVRRLAKDNPNTRTVVMGCYATRDPQAVAKLPNVAEVVPDKRELPDVFDRLGLLNRPDGISAFDGRHRAFVKVQDGCILKCTYCIIPQVRPGLRTRPAASIVEEVKRLVANGYREVVLSGIHIGHYGVESTRGRSGKAPYRLWHLFRELDRIPGDWRMRLSSVEAAEIHDDFLKAAADCERLCPQFHPSMQSGSDTVLKRMRRRYRIGRFLEKLDRMRDVLGEVAFTTDVIVGFPGETEAEFEETLAACERAGYVKVHVFPFSARRGTPAATMPDQVPGDVKKERVARLGEFERGLAREVYRSRVGRPTEVLVERPVPDRPGWVRGTDRFFCPVDLPGDFAADESRLVHGMVEAESESGLTARRVDR